MASHVHPQCLELYPAPVGDSTMNTEIARWEPPVAMHRQTVGGFRRMIVLVHQRDALDHGGEC